MRVPFFVMVGILAAGCLGAPSGAAEYCHRLASEERVYANLTHADVADVLVEGGWGVHREGELVRAERVASEPRTALAAFTSDALDGNGTRGVLVGLRASVEGTRENVTAFDLDSYAAPLFARLNLSGEIVSGSEIGKRGGRLECIHGD